MALLWLLNMSDGENSLLDIADRANLPWETMKQAVGTLSDAGLLKPIVATSETKAACFSRGLQDD